MGSNPIKFVDIVARIAVVAVRRTGLNLILSILATHLDQLTIQQEGVLEKYLPGPRNGDAAHRLDAVAGGYLYNFIGFRPSWAQQQIGGLWKCRWEQIVPGRLHRLIPKDEI